MCKTVCFHKRAGHTLLKSFNGNYGIVKMVPDEVKEELNVIAKIADSAKAGLPLAEEPGRPLLSCLVFYSDAAGASFMKCNGKKMFHGKVKQRCSLPRWRKIKEYLELESAGMAGRVVNRKSGEKGCSYG